MKASQVAWLAGLAAFVCMALIGQAELLGEPWRHWVTVGAVLATAISGYMVQHPWGGEERRGDTGPSYFIFRDGLAYQTSRDGFEQHLRDAATTLPQPLARSLPVNENTPNNQPIQ